MTELLWALAAALLMSIAGWGVKEIVTRPGKKQARLARYALQHELARSKGYTHHLVSEDGDPIGTVEGSSFWPGTWRPGWTYDYAGQAWEVHRR
jgi:hypothetical protein